ncbi:hypothetical protein [Citreicoccus inhibens]|uniref:hypothetical protein n=1 Tax=Citreicoccus inhibens TaxID=2849499 RepID=UPI001EEFB2A7|nr:hypothetical protein [Citreicoccus inhibens]
MAVVVVFMPGGFPLLLAYIAARTLRARWREARMAARAHGRSLSVRDVVANLHFKDLIREARAAL